MFEYHQHQPDSPPLTGTLVTYRGREIARLSFMVWKEQCTLADPPSCFSNCAEYLPRPDLRCRRFASGTIPNPNFSTLRPTAAEITFKPRSRLIAHGNTALQPLETVLFLEELWQTWLPKLNALGRLPHLITRNPDWRSLGGILVELWSRLLQQRNRDPHTPELFLMEVFNPHPDPLPLQLTISRTTTSGAPDSPAPVPPFVTVATLPSGYSRHEIEWKWFSGIAHGGHPFTIALQPANQEESTATLVFITLDLVQTQSEMETPPRQVKRDKVRCVVWDLDHCLWNGTLAEADPQHPRPGVEELIKTLDRRGILNSIASKNHPERAWNTLKLLGLSEYLLAPQINWMPKTINLLQIAETLNLGIDSLALIDDDPAELAEVARNLPMVTCIPADQLASLSTHPQFQGSTSPDARQRRRYYQAVLARERVRKSYGADLQGFLASCKLTLVVIPYQPAQYERVCELVSRTQQLNFSGAKLHRQELRQLLEHPKLDKYLLHCHDRFGEYGIVGFALVLRLAEELVVQELCFSRRIHDKGIEAAFLSHLVTVGDGYGEPPDRITVNFQATAHNQPARQVLEGLRFRPGAGGWSLELRQNRWPAEHVTVTTAPTIPEE